MTQSFLRPLLLMMFVIATISIPGCTGESSTGHVEDKTPAGDATPPLMDDKAMDEYSKKQGEGAPATP